MSDLGLLIMAVGCIIGAMLKPLIRPHLSKKNDELAKAKGKSNSKRGHA